jgi:hypothetical protein
MSRKTQVSGCMWETRDRGDVLCELLWFMLCKSCGVSCNAMLRNAAVGRRRGLAPRLAFLLGVVGLELPDGKA